MDGAINQEELTPTPRASDRNELKRKELGRIFKTFRTLI